MRTFVSKRFFQDTVRYIELSLTYMNEYIVVAAPEKLRTLMNPDRLYVRAKRSRQASDFFSVLFCFDKCGHRGSEFWIYLNLYEKAFEVSRFE